MHTNGPGPGRTDNRALARRDSAFGALQHEVDRLFDSFAHSFGSFPAGTTPTMDVSETDKEIEITAELPGLEERDVQISMAGDVLSIRGEKKSEREEKDRNYRLVERSFGAFSRAIELPADIDPNAIKAVMAKGVLKISIPKPEAKNATRIKVKSAT
ncbi:MAG TPA: Hsp20/alpha crystallin family protein [Caulobacteraceae bacterium]|jgi:HSP20 family protein|nr:Hsp20/alpha crystallin family protein [Caulobacteraceae bacterium]